MRTAVVTLVAATLAGCAAPAPEPAPAAPQAVAAAPRATTGSRLTRAGTDRSIRTIGQQELQDGEPIRSLGNEVGARSN